MIATGLFACTLFIPSALLAYCAGWGLAAAYVVGWPMGAIFMNIWTSSQTQIKSLRETLQTICLWPLGLAVGMVMRNK